MRKILTVFEASKISGYSEGHLRGLLRYKNIKGRKAPVANKRWVWLIKANSLQKFCLSRKKVLCKSPDNDENF